MPEIRIDPLTGLRVIIAAARAAREHAFLDQPAAGEAAAAGSGDPPGSADLAHDPFAEGNESRTPPEVYAVRPDGSSPDTPGWRVRAFANRFPVLDAAASDPARNADPDLFWAGPARGAHEVIVHSPRPITTLAELDREEVGLAVEAWRERMRAHPEASCLHLCVNEGVAAGATIAHSHAQLLALDFVPAAIARERERFGAYATRTMGGSLLGDLLQQEVRRRERLIAVDSEAVLLSPYAARVPYQMMIVPRTPRPDFHDGGPSGAALLHDALVRLRRRFGASPPLNLWVRTAPRGAESFCWRIDILPRLAQPAGIELGTGLAVNVISPERAASELRDAPGA
jgi:UDPglucose--hexose-1-phosphate uridylyltransferase